MEKNPVRLSALSKNIKLRKTHLKFQTTVTFVEVQPQH